MGCKFSSLPPLAPSCTSCPAWGKTGQDGQVIYFYPLARRARQARVLRVPVCGRNVCVEQDVLLREARGSGVLFPARGENPAPPPPPTWHSLCFRLARIRHLPGASILDSPAPAACDWRGSKAVAIRLQTEFLSGGSSQARQAASELLLLCAWGLQAAHSLRP